MKEWLLEEFEANKSYYICELILVFMTLVFIAFLRAYNNTLFEFFEIYENIVERAWAIFREDDFLMYFFIGIINLALIAISIVVNFKEFTRENYMLVINVLISIMLCVLLLIEFANPILTTVFIVTLSILGYALQD